MKKAPSTVALQYYAFFADVALTSYLLFRSKEQQAVIEDSAAFWIVSSLIVTSMLLLFAILIRKKMCILNQLCIVFDLVATEYILSKMFFNFSNYDLLLAYIGVVIAFALIFSTICIVLNAIWQHNRKERKRNNMQKFDFERS